MLGKSDPQPGGSSTTTTVLLAHSAHSCAHHLYSHPTPSSAAIAPLQWCGGSAGCTAVACALICSKRGGGHTRQSGEHVASPASNSKVRRMCARNQLLQGQPNASGVQRVHEHETQRDGSDKDNKYVWCLNVHHIDISHGPSTITFHLHPKITKYVNSAKCSASNTRTTCT